MSVRYLVDTDWAIDDLKAGRSHLATEVAGTRGSRAFHRLARGVIRGCHLFARSLQERARTPGVSSQRHGPWSRPGDVPDLRARTRTPASKENAHRRFRLVDWRYRHSPRPRPADEQPPPLRDDRRVATNIRINFPHAGSTHPAFFLRARSPMVQDQREWERNSRPMKSYISRVIVGEDALENGRNAYHASCPALNGCHTLGSPPALRCSPISGKQPSFTSRTSRRLGRRSRLTRSKVRGSGLCPPWRSTYDGTHRPATSELGDLIPRTTITGRSSTARTSVEKSCAELFSALQLLPPDPVHGRSPGLQTEPC
jgi:hypothetical protein